MDITQGWAENWDFFVEIGAAASICTKLTRVAVPKRVEEKPGFRAFLTYMPILASGLLLFLVWAFPNGGMVGLHAVTIGGSAGYLFDLFNLLTGGRAKKSLSELTISETTKTETKIIEKAPEAPPALPAPVSAKKAEPPPQSSEASGEKGEE